MKRIMKAESSHCNIIRQKNRDSKYIGDMTLMTCFTLYWYIRVVKAASLSTPDRYNSRASDGSGYP